MVQRETLMTIVNALRHLHDAIEAAWQGKREMTYAALDAAEKDIINLEVRICHIESQQSERDDRPREC